MTTTERTSLATHVTGALPRKFLRPLLLLGLSRAERSYGYELAEAVRTYGLNVDMAGIYRELRSMEQHDIVTSDWEPSDNGPRRRVYELTDIGHVAVERGIAELRSARDLLSSALQETW